MVTKHVALRELEGHQGRVLRADTCKAVVRIFIRLAHLELNGKQTQYFASLMTVVTNYIFYWLLQRTEEILRVEEATA